MFPEICLEPTLDQNIHMLHKMRAVSMQQSKLYRPRAQDMGDFGSSATTNAHPSTVLTWIRHVTRSRIRERPSNCPPLPSSPELANEKTAVKIKSNAEDGPDRSPRPKPRSWRPSVLRVGPLSGLCALLFGVLQIFSAYAILRASDGDAVANWKYQPTVYLAALTAISNKALAFAAVQATVVTFWVRALEGTTLGQLHRDWAYGACGVDKKGSSLFENGQNVLLTCIHTQAYTCSELSARDAMLVFWVSGAYAQRLSL